MGIKMNLNLHEKRSVSTLTFAPVVTHADNLIGISVKI